MTFSLTMHPALDGDCIQLTWGNDDREYHLFVDLGRGATWPAVRPILKTLGEIELLVVSHIDADHIAGAIPMVREADPAFTPKRVWYNARPQLEAAHDRLARLEPFGARQAEKLSRGIAKFRWPHNADFASGVVSTDSPEATTLIELEGGLTIRLLSPTDRQLADLLPVWDAELKKAGIRTFDPGSEDEPLGDLFEPLGGAPDVNALALVPYQRDTTEANGASIAFIAEFEGRRVLLAADAHSEVLEAALARLAAAEGGRYRIDLVKVGHHGSKHNTSPAFLKLIDCREFAFSTNGSRRHQHPDAETLARILYNETGVEKALYFNYSQPSTLRWRSALLSRLWRYTAVYPSEENSDGRLTVPIGIHCS